METLESLSMKIEQVSKLVDYVKIDLSKFPQCFEPKELKYIMWTTGKRDCNLGENLEMKIHIGG